ncbi:alpha/beta fold hydrolase [Psychromonas sp. Urea-02u-13]|uniref:alpha/beta fold hydrolase n=1 Tax=Psychromonas sp. Urea-02u-13 TaxID=2058326 RepID=UPI000C34D44A|nr:alpha/beta fold hydrolase [Psychromonas sp. Urea-02u-13]PKG38316.1 alpha/beta hydrolase [Psychromonas sp. Urea-02u-13]
MQAQFIDNNVLYSQHNFHLPLDYQQADSQQIQVFTRELVALDKQDDDLPWLVYLQGGPGFEGPRASASSGWLKRALQQYRVLLLDQRGTGQSSAINHQSLAHLTPSEQALYLSHFRADNIVRDAEAIRALLGIEKWATLGQSFGGFCTLTYLSLFPRSLLHCFITGGIPSIKRSADQVYQATYQRVTDKNKAFFVQFPHAQFLCQEIASFLSKNTVLLPNGQKFTVEQLQLIGINLGRGNANIGLYMLLESAFINVNGNKQLSYSFLNQMQQEQSYLTNPIYALLHEQIYNQGEASNWSAHRVRDEFPQFNYASGDNFYFTGEMVYPWMFEQLATLKPLQAAAQLLAEKQDWGQLYDASILANNQVPVACAVYADDMYVEFDYSRETLANIGNSKAWITNEYEHNGLGVDGEKILGRLIEMVQSIKNLP